MIWHERLLSCLTSNYGLSLVQAPLTSEDQQAYKTYANSINYISLIGSLLFAT